MFKVLERKRLLRLYVYQKRHLNLKVWAQFIRNNNLDWKKKFFCLYFYIPFYTILCDQNHLISYLSILIMSTVQCTLYIHWHHTIFKLTLMSFPFLMIEGCFSSSSVTGNSSLCKTGFQGLFIILKIITKYELIMIIYKFIRTY